MRIMRQKYEPMERIAENNFFVKTKALRLCIITALTTILIIGLNQFTYAQAWYNSGWGYRKAITIDYTKVPNTDQSSFPVLVNLTSDAGLLAHALASGNDILFTSSDGTTKINYQREQYSSGTLVAWVKVPTLSHTANTVIYMYYGNSGATDQQAATSVWDANYKGVWHLDEATGSSSADATSNGNNAAPLNSPAQGAAKISGGLTFNGTTMEDNVSSTFSLGTVNVTMECWANLSSTSLHGAFIKIGGTSPNQGYALGVGSGTFETAGNQIIALYENARWIATGVTFTTGWHHFVLVIDASGFPHVYYDGTQVYTDANGAPLAPSIITYIGGYNNSANRHFGGILDEVCISSSVRSADWIKTEFNNQNLPSTFYSVGAETLLGPTITGFIPASGCANTTPVVITGTNFTGATAVKFGGTDALSFTVNSATQITATPAAGTTGTISVNAPIGPTGTGTSASTFTVNSLPTASATKTDISCFNASNGTITVSGHGGSGSYTYYSITNGLPPLPGNGYSTNPVFTPLAPGQYKIRVIDNNGCESKSVQ